MKYEPAKLLHRYVNDNRFRSLVDALPISFQFSSEEDAQRFLTQVIDPSNDSTPRH